MNHQVDPTVVQLMHKLYSERAAQDFIRDTLANASPEAKQALADATLAQMKAWLADKWHHRAMEAIIADRVRAELEKHVVVIDDHIKANADEWAKRLLEDAQRTVEDTMKSQIRTLVERTVAATMNTWKTR